MRKMFSKNQLAVESVEAVKKAIESGEIVAGGGFEEVEVKLYFSDFDTSATYPRLINDEKKEILSNIASKVKDNKLVIGSYKTPQYQEESSIYLDEANGVVSNESNYWDSKFVLAFGLYRIISYEGGYAVSCSFSYFNTGFLTMQISNAETLFTLMATDPTQYITLKFRIEK